jgi:hypothetical protein
VIRRRQVAANPIVLLSADLLQRGDALADLQLEIEAEKFLGAVAELHILAVADEILSGDIDAKTNGRLNRGFGLHAPRGCGNEFVAIDGQRGRSRWIARDALIAAIQRRIQRRSIRNRRGTPLPCPAERRDLSKTRLSKAALCPGPREQSRAATAAQISDAGDCQHDQEAAHEAG